jgi:hypothetical protein
VTPNETTGNPIRKHLRAGLILLSALFLAHPAESRTFTIASHPCSAPKGRRWPLPEGPGTLYSQGYAFLHQGKGYVLTSHHRVYNGGSEAGVCHSLTYESAYPMRLLAWDWGAGLALFEAPRLAGMKEIPESPLLVPDQGVALSRNGEYGRVTAVGSDRHHVPLLPSGRMDELDSITVASWQVGAPVFTWFDRGGGRFKGIVSHQYVAMQPGRPSRVETWDVAPGHVESHVLMIGEADIYKFLKRYFADPAAWRPSIGVDLEDRRSGRSRVRIGGLYFEEECSGVFLNGCQVRAYPNDFGSWKDYDESLWPERARKLFAELRRGLSQGGSALIPFAFFRDARGRIIPYSYFSLQYFFRQLSFDERKDVVLYEGGGENTSLALAADRLARVLPKDGDPSNAQAKVNLEIRLPAILTLLKSDSWRAVAASDLEELARQAMGKIELPRDYDALLGSITAAVRGSSQSPRAGRGSQSPGKVSLPDVLSLDTVKVTSRLQGDPASAEGSGLLFPRAGRTFAVTSNHVLHPDQEISVSAIRAAGLVSCSARLMAQDSSNGLALLELIDCSLDAEPFPEPARAKRGLEIFTEGFAHGSRTLQSDLRGTVRSVDARHDFFPVGFPLIEISGSTGEYGMSGGVISTEERKYVGMLSHQKVSYEGRTDEDAPLWRNGQKVENRLIVIPGAVVKSWVDLQLSGL